MKGRRAARAERVLAKRPYPISDDRLSHSTRLLNY